MTYNEAYYRRVIGSIGLTMLLFLLLINVFGVVSIVLYELLLLTTPPTAATVIYQVFYATGYMLSFMLPVLLLRGRIRGAHYPYQPMQLRRLPSPWTFLLLPAIVTVIFSAVRINATFVNIVQYRPLALEGAPINRPQGFEWVLELIATCVVPGFCEEFLFRGAIQTNCRPFGRVNAVLIASFMFSMMHQNPAQILYTFVAGIFLGVVYEKTNSLLCCSALHMFNNLAATLEDMIFYGIDNAFVSTVATVAFEIALFIPGVIGLILFAVRFCRTDRTLRNGIFEKDLPAADGYASHPISPAVARRLFLRPSMVVFLVLVLLEVLILLLLGNGFFGSTVPY